MGEKKEGVVSMRRIPGSIIYRGIQKSGQEVSIGIKECVIKSHLNASILNNSRAHFRKHFWGHLSKGHTAKP